MKFKNLLISILIASLFAVSLFSFAACGAVVWDSDIESAEEPAEDSDSSDSAAIKAGECSDSTHYIHAANGRLVTFNADKVLTFTELEHYFGVEYYGLDWYDDEEVTRDCIGHANYQCESCKKDIVLQVLFKGHDLAYDAEKSVITENDLTIIYSCKDCDYETSAENIVKNVEERLADCTNVGGRYVVCSYTIDGKKYNGEMLLGDEYPIAQTIHKFNSKVIDEQAAYTMEQLKEIFGSDLEGVSISDNGYGTFYCENCHKHIAFKIIGEENSVTDEED